MDPDGYGSVMATFVRQALAGEPVTVVWRTASSRAGFTYIDDCIDGTECLRWRRSPPRGRYSTSAMRRPR